MKRALIFGLGLSISLAAPAFAAETGDAVKPVHHPVYHLVHHVYHYAYTEPASGAPNAAAPVAPSFFPHIAPYANGQGDEDGLSRDVNDCNKGCIGGNPD